MDVCDYEVSLCVATDSRPSFRQGQIAVRGLSLSLSLSLSHSLTLSLSHSHTLPLPPTRGWMFPVCNVAHASHVRQARRNGEGNTSPLVHTSTTVLPGHASVDHVRPRVLKAENGIKNFRFVVYREGLRETC